MTQPIRLAPTTELPSLDESGSVFLVRGRLLVQSLYEAITTSTPLALHPAGDVWHYENGRYVRDRHRLSYLVAERLGDHFKPDHVRNLTALAAARLSNSNRVLSTSHTSRLVNLTNGMLDPFAGRDLADRLFQTDDAGVVRISAPAAQIDRLPLAEEQWRRAGFDENLDEAAILAGDACLGTDIVAGDACRRPADDNSAGFG